MGVTIIISGPVMSNYSLEVVEVSLATSKCVPC